MKHRIKSRHHSQQRLRRTHVRVRLFAPNMLLARLQREAVGTVALTINRHAHNAARHRPRIARLRRHIRRVRTAIPNRHAKPLGRADSNIRPHCIGLFQQSQRQRISRNNSHCLMLMQGRNLRCEITQVSKRARKLENRPEDRTGIQIVWIAHNHFNAQGCRPRLHHIDVLRMAILVDEKAHHFGLRHTLGHGHGFRTGRRLVQQ